MLLSVLLSLFTLVLAVKLPCVKLKRNARRDVKEVPQDARYLELYCRMPGVQVGDVGMPWTPWGGDSGRGFRETPSDARGEVKDGRHGRERHQMLREGGK